MCRDPEHPVRIVNAARQLFVRDPFHAPADDVHRAGERRCFPGAADGDVGLEHAAEASGTPEGALQRFEKDVICDNPEGALAVLPPGPGQTDLLVSHAADELHRRHR